MTRAERVARAILVRLADIWSEPTWRERVAAARRFVTFNVRTRMLRRPTVAQLGEHSQIIAYPGETNSPLAVYRNPPNPHQMSVWKRHLAPGDLFIDVGANVGIYTLFALDLGADVIALEADAGNYARLVENLHLNGFDAEALNVAAADRTGTLYFTRGLDSLNHLVLDEHSYGDIVSVPATTIDEILGDRRATGMKIDVEGAEGLVLRGAARALADQRIGIIQFEWSGCALEAAPTDDIPVPEILRGAGYVLFRPELDGRLVLIDGAVEPDKNRSRRDVFALAPAVLHRTLSASMAARPVTL